MRPQSRDLNIATGAGISVHDVTAEVRRFVGDSGIRHGFVTVAARHTTTAVFINENESRLMEDVKAFLGRLIPPSARYAHNDIGLRDCPQDEPENAHSHLAAMLLGSTQVVTVSDGELDLGTWQSVMLCELDGPRARIVSLRLFGSDE